MNNFDLDLGVGVGSKPLNERNNKNRPIYSNSQPGKASWTHQPGPTYSGSSRSELGGPTSMVGDIFGKTWNSMIPKTPNIGIANNNPNLFGDLLSNAFAHNKTTTSINNNAPLKTASPTPPKPSFSTPNTPNPNANRNGGSGIGVGVGVGVGMGAKKADPFGSLLDFSTTTTTKPVNGGGSLNSSSKATHASNSFGTFGFGDFQDALKSTTSTFSSSSVPKTDSFPTQDPFDMFSASGNVGGDDWGLGDGGNDEDNSTTTEIEGLPPPPAGVSGSKAKVKGLDNYKQGQFADAIKWLSWAEVLLRKAGQTDAVVEVLTCRASCYKEVGEYKKAVADCTKVLDSDGTNVGVLVQRALLYESMEKYRLGADDLRTVMKLDPANRVARSTIHRLNKMAD